MEARRTEVVTESSRRAPPMAEASTAQPAPEESTKKPARPAAEVSASRGDFYFFGGAVKEQGAHRARHPGPPST